MTPSHCHNKPRSISSNKCGEHDIASRDPRLDSSGSDAKIKYIRHSSGSDNNIHCCKGRFRCSHSIRKLGHHESHNSRQPDDMNVKEIVEYG